MERFSLENKSKRIAPVVNCPIPAMSKPSCMPILTTIQLMSEQIEQRTKPVVLRSLSRFSDGCMQPRGALLFKTAEQTFDNWPHSSIIAKSHIRPSLKGAFFPKPAKAEALRSTLPSFSPPHRCCARHNDKLCPSQRLDKKSGDRTDLSPCNGAHSNMLVTK